LLWYSLVSPMTTTHIYFAVNNRKGEKYGC
jgi:hypothetical protein